MISHQTLQLYSYKNYLTSRFVYIFLREFVCMYFSDVRCLFWYCLLRVFLSIIQQ